MKHPVRLDSGSGAAAAGSARAPDEDPLLDALLAAPSSSASAAAAAPSSPSSPPPAASHGGMHAAGSGVGRRLTAAWQALTQRLAGAPRAQAPARRARAVSAALGSREEWANRLIGEVFFLLVAVMVWLINAYFTTRGVALLIGGAPLAWGVGFATHIMVTRAELYLWPRWRIPSYLGMLLGCVALDVGTTLIGAYSLVAAQPPAWIGALPPPPAQWIAPVWQALIGAQALPAWSGVAMALLGLSAVMALGSERLVVTFWRGVVEVWQARP